MCLAFVIFALVEFAIIVLISQRKKPRDDCKVAMTLLNEEKIHNTPIMSQTMTMDPLSNEGKARIPTANTAHANNIVGTLLARMRKYFSSKQPTQITDFIAICVYLAMFLVFNCIYWNHYLALKSLDI